MQTFRNKLIALLAVGILAVIGSLMNSRGAAAQGPPDGLAVRIVNPLPVPVTGNTTVSGTVRVKNIDEPGRNPYQFVGGCTGSTGCFVVFPAVPAGKRLVLQHVSAGIGIPTNVPYQIVAVRIPSGPHPVPTLVGTEAGVVNDYQFDQQIVAFFEAGQSPNLQVAVERTGSGAVGVTAFISGYLVDLSL